MKSKTVHLVMLLSLLVPLCLSAAPSIENESTPIEQKDTKTISEIIGKHTTNSGPTPIEREDLKTLKQIKGDTAIEDESTPIEKEDTKSIDQISQ